MFYLSNKETKLRDQVVPSSMLPFLSISCPFPQWQRMAATGRHSSLNPTNPFSNCGSTFSVPFTGSPSTYPPNAEASFSSGPDFDSPWGNSSMTMALNTSCTNYCTDIHDSSLSTEPQVNDNKHVKRITSEAHLSWLDLLPPQWPHLGKSSSTYISIYHINQHLLSLSPTSLTHYQVPFSQ